MLKNATKIQRGWREIGGRRIFFRSKWEYAFAKALQLLKENGNLLEWDHEPKTFWYEKIRRGCRSYCPDFRVLDSDGSTWYAEVKGYMDAKSKTKIKRFKKYYPEERLFIIDKEWFKNNKIFLNGWEDEEDNYEKKDEKSDERVQKRNSPLRQSKRPAC